MGETQEQRCGSCKRTFPAEDFSPSHRGKSGTWCRGCVAANARGERLIPAPHEPRVCDWCGESYVPKQLKANAAYCSKTCKAKARDASPQRRDQLLRSKYGITAGEYDQLLAAQGGGCAVCGRDGSVSRFGILHVDHCHEDKRVRGLLCNRCNLTIGQFEDDPALLRCAAEYLESGVEAAALLAQDDP